MTTRSTRSPRRRTVVALAVVLAVFAGFIVRLVDIQVVNAREHISDSLAYSFGAARTLYGTRGDIVDQSGQTLAGSILLYDAQLDPSNAGPITRRGDDGESVEMPWDAVAASIAEITGQTADDVTRIVEDALAVNPHSQYARLAQGLTTEQYRALAALGIPFLHFEPHPARVYPDGAVAGNLIGFVGAESTPLEGLEKIYDSCLASADGRLSYQRGKDGVTIPGTTVEEPAVDGGTLQLTINRDLQWYMQQLIAEQVQDLDALSGTITVTEVATGKIRAAAEFPTVDPNDVDASEPEDRRTRMFTESFEPGSTFKALTAATLIEAGGHTPASTVTAADRETFANGARVSDATRHDPHLYTLTGVLIDSSNVGISKFAERVPAETRYEYLKKFGVSGGSSVGFAAEAAGWLTESSQWDYQTYYNTAFGQGITTTIPELVGAYLAIANDGVRLPLSLVESCTTADGTVVEPELDAPTRVVSRSTAEDVVLMLENVMTQGGLAEQVAVPGYRVAGKTGTGEKPDGQGGYKSGVYYTTLIGFAPVEDPQYVVAVTLDEPRRVTSSAANAPAFQKAMMQVLKTYRIMPATTEPSDLPKFG